MLIPRRYEPHPAIPYIGLRRWERAVIPLILAIVRRFSTDLDELA